MASSHRLREIRQVLHKHKIITRGISPENLREILEDLGPTYIKLGQVMSLHSDILPQKYCDELMKLQSDVTPMSFEDLTGVIEESYGIPWEEVFQKIESKPLGSASIAQVHRAVLMNGDDVVVKVQRRGVYDVMSRDIGMLHNLVRIMPPVSITHMVDLDLVLDELWMVAQEEMDFIKEARHMDEFARYNRDIRYVDVPKLYQEYTTRQVLVMEYIDGFSVDDKNLLLSNGYDLSEIGTKLVDNYMKQVMEDGFFHADPHPGNIRIRGGKIVWIDMGMMGRLSDRDRKNIVESIRGFAAGDIDQIMRAVLQLGEFRGKPDQGQLYKDIRDIYEKYANLDMGAIDIVEVMQDLMEVLKVNQITIPHGLTLMVRGLAEMEGILAKISPEINMLAIASTRVKQDYWENFDWKAELKRGSRDVYQAVHKSIGLPGLITDALQEFLHGQSNVNLGLYATKEFSHLLRKLVRNLVMGLWVMALLISSSIVCTTDMKPKFLGIPAMGAFGYGMAVLIVLYTILRHLIKK